MFKHAYMNSALETLLKIIYCHWWAFSKWSKLKIIDAVLCTEGYVLDGGYLIWKLKWEKGVTYCKIANVQADCTIKHYGLATVVFNVYDAGPSIKDNTHKRKQENIHYPIVPFNGDT